MVQWSNMSDLHSADPWFESKQDYCFMLYYEWQGELQLLLVEVPLIFLFYRRRVRLWIVTNVNQKNIVKQMSKAEKFIQDYTRTCSNELIAVESRAGKEVVSYHEWLTPDQARSAVEIAREEMIEKAC